MIGSAFLDTNVAYWWATGNRVLSPSVIELISQHPKALMSSLSIAELEMKSMKDRVVLPPNLIALLDEAGVQVENFDIESAVQIKRFAALIGHDPFDRMILAQAARHRNSTFYTADKTLASLGLDWVIHVAK